MSLTAQAARLSFVEQIGATYLAQSRDQLYCDSLIDWRPRRSLWSLVQNLAAKLPQLRLREMQVDGHALRFWDIGNPQQDCVVLLHGFAANKENWLVLAGLLARSHRLLVPDIPGFGDSLFRNDACYAAETQAERLAHWFASTGAPSAHWVGSSMGGAIAGLVAARNPGIVQSLTLMNAAGVVGEVRSPFERALMEGDNHLVPGNFAEVVRLLRLATEYRQAVWASVLPPLMSGDLCHRARVHTRIFHDLLGSNTQPEEHLPQIGARTLVLWGDQDRVLHPSCSRVFQDLVPQAQTRILRGIGHLPMLEAPMLTAKVLRQFWNTPTVAEVSEVESVSTAKAG